MKATLKSLALGLAFLASAGNLWAQTGGYKPNLYYYQKTTMFRSLPVHKGAIVMLGNSLTDGGEWMELLGRNDVLNRGISSDRTPGILLRLDEVIRHEPRKVFLLIGVNDLSNNVPPTKVRDNILKIVSEIKAGSPRTEVYVQSLLPVNDNFKRFNHTKYQAQIKQINKDLEMLALTNGYTYVDLHSKLADDAGKLSSKYTNDGLHLMGEGYVKWVELIRPYL